MSTARLHHHQSVPSSHGVSGGGGGGGGPSSSSAGAAAGAVDRTPFVGHRIPDEVKKMISFISDLDRSVFRLLLTVSALEGKEVNVKELQERTKQTEESTCVIISGLYRLLQLALRSTQKPEIINEDLKELKISDDFSMDIINAVAGQRRPFLLKHALDDAVHLNRLESLKWRVDVGISTSVLNRLLEPSVHMEMILTDGSIHHIEVPMQKFHELRYNVAHVLKEIEGLENRNILKIQD